VLKVIGIILAVGFLAAATVGLAGGGPWWLRYVGSGAVFFLLLLILGVVSGIPNKQELAQRVVADTQKHSMDEPFEVPFAGGERDQNLASRFNTQ